MKRSVCVLGPVTSLLIWRAAQNGMIDLPWEDEFQPDLARCHARLREVRKLSSVKLLGDVPLDVIVGSRARTHRTDSLHVIVLLGTMPPASFFCVEKGVYVCSPELCFALLGRGLNVLRLAELGCELCGTYSIMPDQSGKFRNCPALTSTAKLDSYLKMLGRRHGCRTARKALELVSDESDSPRETSVYLALCAPAQLGGYELRRPQLNAIHTFSERVRDATGHVRVVVDQLYRNDNGEEILAVEYDSKEYHFATYDELGHKTVNVSKVIADDQRREAIRDDGLDMVTIRSDDTTTLDRFEAKALRIARMVGDAPQASEGLLRLKRLDMFAALFDVRRWRAEHTMLCHLAGYDRAIRHPGRVA